MILYAGRACIEAAKAYVDIEILVKVNTCLYTVHALSIAKEPACLITEYYAYTASLYINGSSKLMIYIESIHVGAVGGIIISEVHIRSETAHYAGIVINLRRCLNTHTAIPLVALVAAEVNVTNTSITGPGNIAYLVFQVGYANAQIVQFISIFASELVNGSSLFRIELIFVSHEASDDLCQFVTGNISLTAEGAIRITFYDALVGQLGYRLVSPVRSGNIRKWISCISRYACSQSCYGSCD